MNKDEIFYEPTSYMQQTHYLRELTAYKKRCELLEKALKLTIKKLKKLGYAFNVEDICKNAKE